MTELVVPGSIATINPASFNGCPNLTTVTIKEGVVTIGGSAFVNCNKMTTLTIEGNTLTTISDNAFYPCKALDNLVLPGSVKTLGLQAFRGCIKLSTVTFNEGLESIGQQAFEQCYALKSVTLPSTVNSIGVKAFNLCDALETLDLSHVTSLTTLGDNAFANLAIKSLSLPACLTTIGSSTFASCTSLEEVIIPNTVTKIGNQAFSGCRALTTVTLPTNLTDAGFGTGVFSNCAALTTINLDKLTVITKIPSSTFSGCHALNALPALASNITTIEANAFQSCNGLGTVTFPSTVTTIGNSAFQSSGVVEVTIPASVTSMGTGVFSSCGRLATVTIADGAMPTIPGSTFAYCGALRSISLPASVRTIDGSAFYQSGLTSINFGTGVTSIGSSAFENCNSLTEITIPGNVKTLGSRCFVNCKYLTRVVLEEGVETLAHQPFGGDNRLVSVSLPSTLKSIADMAFYQCNALESLTIPGSVTTIGNSAFSVSYGTPALKFIDMRECVNLSPAITSATRSGIFAGVPTSTIIYLPKGCEAKGDNFVNTDADGNSSIESLTIDQTNGTTFLADIVVSGTVTNARSLAASDADAYTLCVPYGMTLPEGMKAYTMKELDGEGNLVFTEVAVIEANHPYLVTVSETVSNLNVENTTVKQTTVEDYGMGDYEFKGTLVKIPNAEAAAMGAYILQAAKTWHPVSTTNTNAYIAAGRAYIVPKTAGARAMICSVFSDGTTGIGSLKLIDRDGSETWYTLDGRKLDGKPACRGIYVRDGKKIVVH